MFLRINRRDRHHHMGRTKTPKASATVRVIFRTQQQTKAIAHALTPELSHPAGEKARARIMIRGKKLSLRFEARNSTTLRAIMSSYLRMLAASLNVSDSLMQLEHSHQTRKSDKSPDE